MSLGEYANISTCDECPFEVPSNNYIGPTCRLLSGVGDRGIYVNFETGDKVPKECPLRRRPVAVALSDEVLDDD